MHGKTVLVVVGAGEQVLPEQRITMVLRDGVVERLFIRYFRPTGQPTKCSLRCEREAPP
jgi:hypothetical protein